MDICNRDLVALSRSLSFIMGDRRQHEKSVDWKEGGQVIPCGEEIVHFDVIGVVGPDTSREAVMVSSLLSLFEIPVFVYFMRPVMSSQIKEDLSIS